MGIWYPVFNLYDESEKGQHSPNECILTLLKLKLKAAKNRNYFDCFLCLNVLLHSDKKKVLFIADLSQTL